MTLTHIFLLGLSLYLVIGAVVGGWFLIAAAGIDPAYRAAPWKVRVLFYPGAVAIWPIVLTRIRTFRAGDCP